MTKPKITNQTPNEKKGPQLVVNQQPPNVGGNMMNNMINMAVKPEGKWCQNPNLRLLSSRPAIAWDWMGTVVLGRASLVIQQFILTHPKIHHYIITTSPEDTDLVEMVNEDLAMYKTGDYRTRQNAGLTAGHFTKIIGCNHVKWQLGLDRIIAREKGTLSGPFDANEYYVCFFKEQICQDLAIPVLVDDQLDRAEGCRMFGIKFIDPNRCI